MVVLCIFCLVLHEIYLAGNYATAMEERDSKKLLTGLMRPTELCVILEVAQGRATDQMKEAKQEAAGIVDQANKRANQIIDEAKQQATAEGDRLKVAAEAEIEQEINRAKEELRASVAGLALAGAEKVLEASIDDEG